MSTEFLDFRKKSTKFVDLRNLQNVKISEFTYNVRILYYNVLRGRGNFF